MTDKNIVKKIIDAAELAPDDTVLEVGPGLGVMTREILPRVGHLVAVELDPFFVHELRAEFAEAKPRQGARYDVWAGKYEKVAAEASPRRRGGVAMHEKI